MGPGLGGRSRIRAVPVASQRTDCRPTAARPPGPARITPRLASAVPRRPLACAKAPAAGSPGTAERIVKGIPVGPAERRPEAAGRVRQAPIAAVVSEFGANDTTLRFRGGAPGTGRVFRTAPDTVGAGKFEFVGAERADGPVSHPADSRTRHKGYLSLVVAGPVVPRSHGKNSRSGYLCFRQVFASIMVTPGRSIMR